eukprot:XP_001699241.1 predicted protein [Chlamydomonas reinhardtii]
MLEESAAPAFSQLHGRRVSADDRIAGYGLTANAAGVMELPARSLPATLLPKLGSAAASTTPEPSRPCFRRKQARRLATAELYCRPLQQPLLYARIYALDLWTLRAACSNGGSWSPA